MRGCYVQEGGSEGVTYDDEAEASRPHVHESLVAHGLETKFDPGRLVLLVHVLLGHALLEMPVTLVGLRVRDERHGTHHVGEELLSYLVLLQLAQTDLLLIQVLQPLLHHGLSDTAVLVRQYDATGLADGGSV